MKGARIFYWLPRILSIAFVLFLSLFALDVFSEYSGWNIMLPLFMHLIPSFILLGVAIISWKYDLVGAVIFFGFAVFYVFAAGFDRPWQQMGTATIFIDLLCRIFYRESFEVYPT